MSYEHIFFDLDRTLWNFEKNSSEALHELLETHNAHALGIKENEFIERYQIINELLWDEYRRNKISKEQLRTERFLRTFNELGIKDKELPMKMSNDYITVSVLKTHLYADTHEVLQYLSDKYHLHIITNGFEETQYHKINNCKLDKYFKTITTSEKAGVNKPHRDVFEYALRAAKAKRQKSLMIGDHIPADIIGARRAGIDQVFMNHRNETHGEKITYEVKSLIELKSLF